MRGLFCLDSMSIESTYFLSALAARLYEQNASSQRLGCLKNCANLFGLGRSITANVVRSNSVVEQKNLES